MDYQNELLGQYYEMLNGSIIVDGQAVNVGTKIPNNTSYFVKYDVFNDTDIGTFDVKAREVDIQIECVHIQQKHLGDDSIVNSLVEQVKRSLDFNSFSMANWRLELLLDEGTIATNSEDDEYYTYRRTITFKNFIIEK